jgi:hypothetical protein
MTNMVRCGLPRSHFSHRRDVMTHVAKAPVGYRALTDGQQTSTPQQSQNPHSITPGWKDKLSSKQKCKLLSSVYVAQRDGTLRVKYVSRCDVNGMHVKQRSLVEYGVVRGDVHC